MSPASSTSPGWPSAGGTSRCRRRAMVWARADIEDDATDHEPMSTTRVASTRENDESERPRLFHLERVAHLEGDEICAGFLWHSRQPAMCRLEPNPAGEATSREPPHRRRDAASGSEVDPVGTADRRRGQSRRLNAECRGDGDLRLPDQRPPFSVLGPYGKPVGARGLGSSRDRSVDADLEAPRGRPSSQVQRKMPDPPRARRAILKGAPTSKRGGKAAVETIEGWRRILSVNFF